MTDGSGADVCRVAALAAIIAALLLFSAPALYCATRDAGPLVTRIEVLESRSRPEAVRALLDTKVGAPFDEAVWEEDLQRLRDSGLFYLVRGEALPDGAGVALRLAARNKFGTIPILKYKEGGGSSLLTAGVYEVNLLGRLLEAGGQYERMNGRDGGVVWFRHPYLLSRQNRLGAELYVHVVDLPLFTKQGAEEAFFANDELRGNLWFERALGPSRRVALQLSLYRNRFEDEAGDGAQTALNAAFLEKRPLRDGTTVSLAPRLVLGRIGFEGIAVRGSELTFEAELAHGAIGSDFDFARAVVSWIGAARPHPAWNLAAQARLGTKSGREFQHKFYLGGLDSVRGFLDGQFRGEHIWLLNVEARPTLLERPLWALQGNIFADLSKTWDARAFGLEGFESPFVSAGAGLRVILPRVYRGVLRADVAWTFEPVRQTGVSVGLQQFF